MKLTRISLGNFQKNRVMIAVFNYLYVIISLNR
jgi:hypothetical protein